jgi:uncharacterized delta-60 repeat protein
MVAGAAAMTLAASLTGIGTASAAGGGLDPSFGGDGKVTTPFKYGGYATAVAVQADGKVVVVGAAGGEPPTGDFAVARYLPDGRLDPSFGGDGKVVTPVGVDFDEANAVAIDGAGRIVVAGHADRERFTVARYLSNGTLDPTFDGDGIVTTEFTPGYDIAHGIAIQPNGRIVVAGQSGTEEPWYAMARYRADGTLDPAFGGGDGKVRTRMGMWGVARAVALQADGKIVLAGSGGMAFTLARYRRDGSLDPTFGGDGRVSAGPYGWADALAIRADGRIVVGGDWDIFRFAVARYLPNGHLDPSFSGDGWVRTSVGSGEQGVHGLVLRPNGKVVAVGYIGPHEFGDPVVPRIVLVRYTAHGRLDRTFGHDGKVETRFAGGVYPRGSAKLPNGGIVVVGGAGAPDKGTESRFAVACYLP